VEERRNLVNLEEKTLYSLHDPDIGFEVIAELIDSIDYATHW